jgi:hypothetical protein
MAGAPQDRSQKGGGRAFAVGSRNQRAAQPELRVAGPFQDRAGSLQAELDPEPAEAGEVLDRFGVGQARRRTSAS